MVTVPGTPSSLREVSDSWQNSSRVASVRNSGRSSRARHSSAVSTARTGSGRGRPVRWASAASMTGALPERSMSSAAKATVCVADAAAGGGRVRPAPLTGVRSARQRARRAPLEELMPATWRA